ncbi:hypothetical protein LMG28138_05981 [Pararobbsia alpina]|uniref:Uncharacterized protein n=1 Tax=Pararobbsia alpina TaxID=621374 RepID=A0A6S7BP72_9BURK|nr:hypothetical protein LMG28138_05981 [Pararobbsia alpina]
MSSGLSRCTVSLRSSTLGNRAFGSPALLSLPGQHGMSFLAASMEVRQIHPLDLMTLARC